MRDEAMFEAAGSRWAVTSDDHGSSGLAVLTEAKYGFSCRDGALGVSLIRSPLVSGEEHRDRNLFHDNLRKLEKPSLYTDQGKHTIRIALSLSELTQAREMQPSALAESLFTPALPYTGKEVSSGFIGLTGDPTLQPVWDKPARDGNGWILRLNETMGQRGAARIELADGFQAIPTTLLEKDGTKAVSKVTFKPYELISLRICRV
jgi:alpha-mannosidase